MIHTNALIVWLLLGFFGSAYHLIPEEAKRDIESPMLAYAQLAILMVGALGAVIGYTLGIHERRSLRQGVHRGAAPGAGDLVFDAAIVGPLLGLEPGAFMEELKKGMVHQVHEQGTGVGHGRRRVTFRYRARQSVLILDALARAMHVA